MASLLVIICFIAAIVAVCFRQDANDLQIALEADVQLADSDDQVNISKAMPRIANASSQGASAARTVKVYFKTMTQLQGLGSNVGVQGWVAPGMSATLHIPEGGQQGPVKVTGVPSRVSRNSQTTPISEAEFTITGTAITTPKTGTFQFPGEGWGTVNFSPDFQLAAIQVMPLKDNFCCTDGKKAFKQKIQTKDKYRLSGCNTAGWINNATNKFEVPEQCCDPKRTSAAFKTCQELVTTPSWRGCVMGEYNMELMSNRVTAGVRDGYWGAFSDGEWQQLVACEKVWQLDPISQNAVETAKNPIFGLVG